jgi:type II secretory pathway pseudopilin PulG
MRIHCSNSRAGFNLIQISILLTVASLVMVAALPSPQSAVKNNATSVVKMNAILTALRQYQTANATLPCPADPTLPVDSANYGLAAVNAGATGNCIGGTPSAAYADSTNHIAIGMVPFRDLGLSYDYALDAWGRDITYAVDTNATAFTTPLCNSPSFAGAITVNDYGISHNTVVTLVSHGKDGYGAWLPLPGSSGTAKRLDSGSTDTNQADNAQVAHGGGLTANTTFTSFKNQNATSTFDDNVVYKGQYNLNVLPHIYTQTTAYNQTCNNGYYRTVTIDHTKVPNTDQTNFPMLFSGTYSYLATVANGGNVQNANGYDIYFSSDAAGASELNFEQESYNAATGQVTYWVQVPTVSHTSDTVIYLQYGKASITTDQSNKTGTWDSNYMGVWHLDETSGTTNADSTSNGATISKISATSPAPLAGAKINGGDSFNGSSDTATASSALTDLTGDMTLEMWVNEQAWGDQPSTSYSQRFACDQTDANNGYQLTNYGSSTDGSGFVWHVKIAGTSYIASTSNSGGYSLNTWYHVVGTYKSSSHAMLLYVNGTLPSSGTASGWNLSGSAGHLKLGARVDNNGLFHGYLDEVRLSNSVRAADWIATEYNNQSSPSTFYTIGAQTSSR